MNQSKHNFILRIDQELFDKLKTIAKKNKCSINSTIVALLHEGEARFQRLVELFGRDVKNKLGEVMAQLSYDAPVYDRNGKCIEVVTSDTIWQYSIAIGNTIYDRFNGDPKSTHPHHTYYSEQVSGYIPTADFIENTANKIKHEDELLVDPKFTADNPMKIAPEIKPIFKT